MNNNEVIEYITKSFDLKRQGYYKPAIEMLYKALNIENNNVEILSQLAELYYLLGNYQRAKNYIEKTLELNNNHFYCLDLMRKILVSEKNYNEALNIANKIYEIYPTEENLIEKLKILKELNGEEHFAEVKELENSQIDFNCTTLFNFASIHYNNKDYDGAIKLLEKAHNLNPDNIEVSVLLADSYFKNENFDKSKMIFDKLKDNNDNPIVMNSLGLFKLDEMKYEDAIEYFTKAVKLSPQNSEYIYNLANAYFFNGWLDEAAKCYNNAICLNTDNIDYHYSLAYLYIQKQEYKKALNELKIILEKNSNYMPAIVLSAKIKALTGNPVQAEDDLNKVIQENPNNLFALSELAKICVELNQNEKAEKLMKQVINIDSDTQSYLSDYANILITNKKYGDAQEIIEKLINLKPNYVEGYILQAKNYIGINDYESAYNTAQKIIDIDMNNAEGYFYNAIALFEQGDVNFAIETLKKAISLDVNNADYYVQMSEFYQHLARYEDALAYIGEAASIDESAKNKELYSKLANIVRKSRIS